MSIATYRSSNERILRWSDDRGSDIVEYAMILALIVLAIIGSLYAVVHTIFQ